MKRNDGKAWLVRRRFPIGSELFEQGAHFRLWAPRHSSVELLLEDESGKLLDSFPMMPEKKGYFSTFVDGIGQNTLYRYRLGQQENAYPDPASRFQPQGPHGPSATIDSTSFQWTDQSWKGVPSRGQVLYEMHIGTFTPEGSWAAAMRELEELARLGVSVLEVMPVADFPGKFGWGYDGVDFFAPTRLYGTPEDFRRFINQAHALGLGVILDVVYNHLGPEGNYLGQYAQDYFTDRYENEWGQAINFDGENSQGVREFFIANAGYWIEEFHLDGLRIDATQQMFDHSPRHILSEITREIQRRARGRETFVVAENEPQDVCLVCAPAQGGYGMQAMWNDDFHHSARVALTGKNDAYFSDYRGSPQELISALKWGYLYQGQRFEWQNKRRGTPALHLKPLHFVHYIQNHDQVANSAQGLRCHFLTNPGRYRAMTALLLLGPATPMLFQGQEFASSSPFLYFADHPPELAEQVWKGRRAFLSQFRSIALPQIQSLLANPADPDTFQRSKLIWEERETHREIYLLHQDLLRLRREDPVLNIQADQRIEGAVLSPESFLIRFFNAERGEDRLLVVNFGMDLHFRPAPEPLLAPLSGKRWEIDWSSEDPRYGGDGTPMLDTEEGWKIPGHAAVLLQPARDWAKGVKKE